jgi:YD repeat-containing protein
VQAGTLTPVEFNYDAPGRLATLKQSSRTLTYGYTSKSKLSSIVDPLSRTLKMMLWLTVLGLIVVLVSIVTNLRKTTKQWFPSSQESGRDMLNKDSRHQFESMLARRERFRVTAAPPVATEYEQLGPVTREFFARYQHVEVKPGTIIGVDLLAPSTHATGFISIGHSEDWDVVQRPGDDRVFVVEGSERSEAEIEVRYATVYDFLLDETDLLKGE